MQVRYRRLLGSLFRGCGGLAGHQEVARTTRGGAPEAVPLGAEGAVAVGTRKVPKDRQIVARKMVLRRIVPKDKNQIQVV